MALFPTTYVWKHGGKRKGAGRPTVVPGVPSCQKSVTMPESYWEIAAQLGDGNHSAGIRLLIENYTKTRRDP